MEQNVTTILFALLRSAVCGTKLTGQERAQYSPGMLPELLRMASKHDVAHLLVVGLKKNDLLTKEDAKLEAYILKAVYRYERMRYAYEDICNVLEEARIPFIPLKGSVIRDYYPEPWMRTSCDIDVLVHEEDTGKAEAYLLEAGYTRGEDATTHDYCYYSPRHIHVELHYTLTQENFTVANNALTDVWQYVTPVRDGSWCYAMEPEYFLLYHLAHMAKHILHGGCGLRPFLDLWLLEHKMPYDKEKCRRLLENTKLWTFSGAAKDLSCVWLESAEHTPRTWALSNYIMTGGVYGTTENSAQMKAARGESKAKSFWDLVFLSRESLAVLYPILKTRPYLYPLYQVKRWFRIFDRRKRHKIRYLTRMRICVSTDEIRDAQTLLASLGLD